MKKSLEWFNESMKKATEHSSLHDILKGLGIHTLDCDDLLRYQLVHIVSALDKLIHDLIISGMVESFVGLRPPTAKFVNEQIPVGVVQKLLHEEIPPKEYTFRELIAQKLKTISYQHPDKIAEGLSYIWDESHKWKKIAAHLDLSDNDLKKSLILLITRRNAIVHESDIDPISRKQNGISREECESATALVSTCGNAIASLVMI